jgi:hypothetical protein
MKTAVKITAIAIAFPALSFCWAMGFLAFSFAWQTPGSMAYLVGTSAVAAALVGRYG